MTNRRNWAPRRKYGNVHTVIEGVRFDSRLEAARWVELRLLEKAGEIFELTRQITLTLTVNGKKIGTIRPDFHYREKSGIYVYEDAKGAVTPDWATRWKLAQALFPDCEFRIFQKRKSFRRA